MPTIVGGISATNQASQDKPLLVLTSSTGFSFSTSVIKSVSYGKSATFNQQKILNRSSPVITYDSSEAITIEVTFPLFAYSKKAWDANTSQQFVKALMSLTFPQQSGTMPPPLCMLTLHSGYVFNNYNCVVTSVKYSPDDGPYDETGDPFFGEISLSLLGVELQAQDQTDWSGSTGTSFSNLAMGATN